MKSYSYAARAFLATVWFLGLTALAAVLLLPPLPGDHFPLSGVLLAGALSAIAGARKVTLIRSARFSEAGCMSLGFLITVAALLAFGVRAAVFVGIISGLSAGLYPHRQPLHQLLFNVAAIAATAWATGQTYALLNNGVVGQVGLRSLEALLAATLVYFLLNTGAVACIIGLCSGKQVGRVWQHSFLWTAPSYFAGASCAALGQLLFRSEQRMLLLALPVLHFVYKTYTLYVESTEQKRLYIEELQTGRQMLADLYLSTVKALASAIDAKDQYTYAHAQHVQSCAVAIAEKLKVEGAQKEAVVTGALLHDIGKLGVPDYVLLKPGPLTPDEFDKMKRHTSIGAAILEQVKFPWPVVSAVRHHHERWDGTGYPDRLAGEDIPLEARILAVADVYDALTSDRPYRPAWAHAQALEYLRAEAGSQFDPRVVSALVEVTATAEQAEAENPIGAAASAAEEENITRHIRRTTSEMWALYEISQTLTSDLDMEARITQLSRKITTFMPGTYCAFLLYDPRSSLWMAQAETEVDRSTADASPREELLVWAATGEKRGLQRGVYARWPDSLIARVERTRRPYCGPYSEDSPMPLAQMPWPVIRSTLIVPLVHQGETLGTITLYHPEADVFSDDDQHLMMLIAEQVQSTLYQNILFDRTRSDALTDALTGLPNTRYLLRNIEPILQRPSHAKAPASCALLYLDLDNFKPINDTFGHEQGNAVLREIARLFQRELRPDDMVIRYGGDEFVIVLPQTGKSGALQVAARIRKAVRDYRTGLIHPVAGEPRLDVSIGIACYPRDGQEINRLIAIADDRMYADKATHALSPPDAPVQAAVQDATPAHKLHP